jgi:hypothetical protein
MEKDQKLLDNNRSVSAKHYRKKPVTPPPFKPTRSKVKRRAWTYTFSGCNQML